MRFVKCHAVVKKMQKMFHILRTSSNANQVEIPPMKPGLAPTFFWVNYNLGAVQFSLFLHPDQAQNTQSGM